jgi:hypothetical protein
MSSIVSGLAILAWGIWCFISAIKGHGLQAQTTGDSYLIRKIFGKYYDVIMNIIIGIICVFTGFYLILKS